MRIPLAALLFGGGFGFVLGWARLSDPDVIHAMLRLREPDVYLLMGAAIATASLGARLLRARGARSLLDGAPVAWRTASPARHHLTGAVLFGIGWSVTSSCPGPVAVQIGRGEIAGGFTALGLLAGIALRDAMRERRAGRDPALPRAEAPAAASPGL